MLKVVSNGLWRLLSDKAATAKSRRAAVAYVTKGGLLPFAKGDVLVTDASDAAISGGRTSAPLLAKYFGLGVELFSLKNLHAKALILDDWAVIGSANASKNSATYFIEAAVITDRPEIVGQTERLILSLTRVAMPIDQPFIKRICQIPVTRSDGPPLGVRRPRRVASTPEQRFWFLGIADDEPYPGNTEAVESAVNKLEESLSRKAGDVDWLWWSASARFAQKASIGDVVIDCWRPHVKIVDTKAIKVYRHARIAKIVEENGVKAKAFLCIWPPNSDKSALSWSSFLSLLKRARVERHFTPNSAIELTARQSSALYELWNP